MVSGSAGAISARSGGSERAAPPSGGLRSRAGMVCLTSVLTYHTRGDAPAFVHEGVAVSLMTFPPCVLPVNLHTGRSGGGGGIRGGGRSAMNYQMDESATGIMIQPVRWIRTAHPSRLLPE